MSTAKRRARRARDMGITLAIDSGHSVRATAAAFGVAASTVCLAVRRDQLRADEIERARILPFPGPHRAAS